MNEQLTIAIPEDGALSRIEPIARSERIELLDVLRGFALFGILLVNMVSFGLPEGIYPHELWPGFAEVTAERFILFFGEGKFISLFSFLFGVGLAIQASRAEARGARFLPLYMRRLLVLLLLGVAHMILLWEWDILHTYAIGGFVLLLFRKRRPRTLLVWSAVFFLILVLPLALLTTFTVVRHVNPNAWSGVVVDDDRDEEQQAAKEALRIHSQGTYRDMVELRSRDMPWALIDPALFYVLFLFLLGLYAGRRGIFQNLGANLPWIRRARWWCLGIGLAGNGVVAAINEPQTISATAIGPNLSTLIVLFAAPALSFFYASTIVILTQEERWRARLAPLAAVGRMALSNYLLQSLICTTIFNSYGLGLYGTLSPSRGLILTVIIYAIQVPFSVWWLRRFQFGPAEWLWRSATYAHFQRMRRA